MDVEQLETLWESFEEQNLENDIVPIIQNAEKENYANNNGNLLFEESVSHRNVSGAKTSTERPKSAQKKATKNRKIKRVRRTGASGADAQDVPGSSILITPEVTKPESVQLSASTSAFTPENRIVCGTSEQINLPCSTFQNVEKRTSVPSSSVVESILAEYPPVEKQVSKGQTPVSKKKNVSKADTSSCKSPGVSGSHSLNVKSKNPKGETQLHLACQKVKCIHLFYFSECCALLAYFLTNSKSERHHMQNQL